MAKKIEIVAVESGVKAVAELHENAAAQTCELMWKCLETPMETEGIQAMWVGPELMFLMPEENQKGDPTTLPLENATAYPQPGDVLFAYYPPGITQQYYDDFRDKPVWDFFLIFGPDPILGGTGVTVWAHITEGLEGFAQECSKVRLEGNKPFRVRRLEE
jgi:hypothetical protein